MEYSIEKLAKLAGITTRTLRYYDEIKLLKPARISKSGYRVYGSKEVNLLQQILIYKELGLELETIKKIIYTPSFNFQNALEDHLEKLNAKKMQIEDLIANVSQSLRALKGGLKMSDKEKFNGLKKKLIMENEEKYGNEVRQKYGEEKVQKANEKFMNMSEEDFNEATRISEEIMTTLKEALIINDPESEVSQKVAKLHQQWLKFYWPNYSREAHINLVKMYLEDERFTAFYDKVGKGATKLLTASVIHYLSK